MAKIVGFYIGKQKIYLCYLLFVFHLPKKKNMTTEELSSINNDPDYQDFHESNKNDPNYVRAADSKDLTISKIKTILEKQFAMELEFKEQEILKVEHRINTTKSMLDRLRAYVAAGYFGSGGLVVPGSKAVTKEPKNKKAKPTIEATDAGETASILKILDSDKNTVEETSPTQEKSISEINELSNNKDVNESRFYNSKKLIVGNVSKYLLADARKENDRSTHKWMVYVRTESGDDKEIEKYVKSVLFFLHPSYIPNDIVTVTRPPFQVTRRGWGEFPIRVQLHFRDSRNKRFDVIHNLKLDKTYTGLQTLGAETVVNIELHKHASGDHEIISRTPSERSSPIPPISSQDQGSNNNELPSETNKEERFSKEDIEALKMSLPALADLKSKLPSVECASSCVSSANPSRCNSPTLDATVFSYITVLDSEIDSRLYQLLHNAPLIGSDNVKVKFFTCPSIDLYESWHFTKRRAIEWYRAKCLQKLFQDNYPDLQSRCPSTKDIMIWCRQCGFTPPEKNLNVILRTLLCCRKCGKCLSKDSNQNNYCSTCKDKSYQPEPLTDSLTPYDLVLSNVKIKEKTLECLEKVEATTEESNISDVDLDVIKINTDSETSPIVKQGAPNEIASTLAEHWVSDVLYHFGLPQKPFVMGDTKTPVVQAMLLRGMKLFMCQLLRKSNIEAKQDNKSSLEPALITFRHVHSAILKEPLFDFLTDAHLGKL